MPDCRQGQRADGRGRGRAVRRGLTWSTATLGSLALTAALIAATATPEAQPNLITGPSWRATQDVPGMVPRGPIADAAWLSLGSVPGKGTRWEDMGRVALLDLHQLSQPSGAVAAGAGGPCNYAWPRDTAFVAVALARTGHHAEALQALTFLQRVQLGDGGFEARYLLNGSGPPDGRARQSDGAGWALWALGEVSQSSRDKSPPPASPSGSATTMSGSATSGSEAAAGWTPQSPSSCRRSQSRHLRRSWTPGCGTRPTLCVLRGVSLPERVGSRTGSPGLQRLPWSPSRPR